MKKLIAVAACALSMQALAADPLAVRGSTAARLLLAPHLEAIHAASGVDLVVSSEGTGQAVLDILDGKASAAVVTVPLVEAVAAAREAAWAQGRMIRAGDALRFHAIAWMEEGSRPLGFITAAPPSAELEGVMRYLRSEPARAMLER